MNTIANSSAQAAIHTNTSAKSAIRPLLAILAAAFVTFMVGGLWHADFAFGSIWQQSVDKASFTSAQEARGLGITFGMFILVAIGIRMQLDALPTWRRGLKTGLILGALLAASYTTVNNAWELKPLALCLAQIGWAIVSFGIIGTIVGAIDRPRS